MGNKVVLIAVDFVPNVGGIAQYLYRIISHLPPEDLTVIALPSQGDAEFDRLQPFAISRLKLTTKPNRFLPVNKLWGPFFFWELLRMPAPALVVCGQCNQALLFAAWLLKIVKKVPYFVFAYGNDVLFAQNKWHRQLNTYWLNSAAQVVAISQTTARIVINSGVSANRVQILHPCIAQDPYADDVRAKISHTDSLQAGRARLMTVGRLVERKGHDVVLQALPIIREQIPQVHYVIVGDGPEEKRLKDLAAALEISEMVTFAGYISDDDLRDFYADCTVFVMVSREIAEKGDVEGFGIVYLEANWYGLPVVAGKSGGVVDAVIDEETGLLVDPTDETAVAHAIIRLLKEPALATRLGQQGRKRVMGEFGCDKTARKFLAIINSCIER